MKPYRGAMASLCLTLAFGAVAVAQEANPEQTVLITNARVFDGEHEALGTGMSVLVDGNKIAKIAKSISAPAGATAATVLRRRGAGQEAERRRTRPDRGHMERHNT